MTERWDNQSHHGEYVVVVGDRFSVSISGSVVGNSEIKSALKDVDPAGLAALENLGTRTN